MTVETEIYNEVLVALGVTPNILNSMTDESPRAKSIRAVWHPARKFVLREQAWGWASRQKTLTLLGTPRKGWGFQYAYPVDCIQAVEIEREVRRSKAIPFKVAQWSDPSDPDIAAQKVILTDQEQATLIYTGDEQDPSMFDPHFRAMFVANMAFRICHTITTDENAPKEYWERYVRAKSGATTSDSNEQVPDDPADADWITARSGGSVWQQ